MQFINIVVVTNKLVK